MVPGGTGSASGALVVIPARFHSVRLPAKPLLDVTGKPLVVHTLERALAARSVGRAVVATDDERIVDAVRSNGGEAVMTSPDHESGTDRVAEVAREADAEVVVNLQGDEPEVDPALIDALVAACAESEESEMATASVPFQDVRWFESTDAVKVVVDSRGRALYFSRSCIPHWRDRNEPADRAEPRLHVGIYAFRRDALLRFAALPATPLERCERLEQLRALEHGMRIRVVEWPRGHVGIDTAEDYEGFVARYREGA